MPDEDGSNEKTADAEEVCVRLERALIDGIDKYASGERDALARPEAVRRIVQDWLRTNGLLRHPERQQRTRPEDLSSANDG